MTTDRPTAFPDERGWGYDPKRRVITYRYTYRGKENIERGDSFDDCRRKRARRERDIEALAQLSENRTTGQVIDGWLKAVTTGKAGSTRRDYITSANHFRRELDLAAPFGNIEIADIEAMWVRMVGRSTFGPDSLEKRSTHWCGLLDYAATHKLILRDHREDLRSARRPHMAPKPTSKRRPNWFALRDYRRMRTHLIEAGGARNTYFLLMMLTGARPAEALAVQWEYLEDPEAEADGDEIPVGDELHIDWTIKRVKEDKLAEGEFLVKSPTTGSEVLCSPILKTDHLHDRAHRAVPLAPDLKMALSRLPRTSRFAFIDDEGRGAGGLIGFDAIKTHSYRLATDLRVPMVKPNGYRHTFASVCRHHHMQYERLAELMGHVNTRQIIETYGHPLTDMSVTEMDRFLG